MKRSLKFISLALAVLMLGAALASCGDKKDKLDSGDQYFYYSDDTGVYSEVIKGDGNTETTKNIGKNAKIEYEIVMSEDFADNMRKYDEVFLKLYEKTTIDGKSAYRRKETLTSTSNDKFTENLGKIIYKIASSGYDVEYTLLNNVELSNNKLSFNLDLTSLKSDYKNIKSDFKGVGTCDISIKITTDQKIQEASFGTISSDKKTLDISFSEKDFQSIFDKSTYGNYKVSIKY